MTNASADLFSTCLQVIIISWLVMAVETRAFAREGRTWRTAIGLILYGMCNVLTVGLCLWELGIGPIGDFGVFFVILTTFSMAATALVMLFIAAWEATTPRR